MHRPDRGTAIALACLAAGLGGCSSSDVNLSSINVLPRLEAITQQRLSYSAPANNLEQPPVTSADLVNPDGSCAATAQASDSVMPNGTDLGGPSSLLGSGIALQMSECDVVRRAGAPEQVEFGNDRQERRVVLTYTQGPRPGIYRFNEGRLVSIERAPGAAAPAKPQKAPRASKKSA